MKKRIFASILAVVMLLGVVSVIPAFADGEGGVKISAADVIVRAGVTEAEIIVTVSDIPAAGLSSAYFNIKVEGASIVSGAGADALPEGGYAQVGPTEKSATAGVNFMWVDINSGLTADAQIAVFQVALPEGAVCGDEYPVVITLSDDPQDFTALDGTTDVAAVAENGKITVVHSLTHVEAVAATCTEDGSIEYWSCDKCGKLFSDEDAATEITSDDLAVPAAHTLTHVEAKEATKDEDGNIEYWYCEVCEKYFSDAEATTEIDAESIVVKYVAPFKPADANGDGKLNNRDVILVMRAAIPGFQPPANFVFEAADMNGDGKINSRDIIAVMRALLAAG